MCRWGLEGMQCMYKGKSSGRCSSLARTMIILLSSINEKTKEWLANEPIFVTAYCFWSIEFLLVLLIYLPLKKNNGVCVPCSVSKPQTPNTHSYIQCIIRIRSIDRSKRRLLIFHSNITIISRQDSDALTPSRRRPASSLTVAGSRAATLRHTAFNCSC